MLPESVEFGLSLVTAFVAGFFWRNVRDFTNMSWIAVEICLVATCVLIVLLTV